MELPNLFKNYGQRLLKTTEVASELTLGRVPPDVVDIVHHPAGSILPIEPKRFNSGYKHEPARDMWTATVFL
ncbi:hypothetical protein SCALIN_C13_0107 [Candidatus Scalindua japonica]|uniref:Uncharacterized protein n=1 Tax=Candidatus Scalindua japonica TaxID=1284222 RepID=A0A286TXK6_9BACT|nr:hypothetical protein [Candidatus Scalindua japonica]GAX60594.1 hypothetical protein SCALIN_C13_0107 [Candidatus Scalindua japonica]